MKIFYILIFALLSVNINAQEILTLQEYNDSLRSCFNNMLIQKNDLARNKANEVIINLVKEMLSVKESFDYEIDSLQNLGIIKAPDNKFKIYSWNTNNDDGTFKYFAYLQTKGTKKKPRKVFFLNDNSDKIKDPKNKILTQDNWFGSLYYDIILTKHKRKKSYILLAWDGNNIYTTKKIIEILTFDKDGNSLSFGKEELPFENKTTKRIIFEYGNRMSMSLKYYKDREEIIFDHITYPDKIHEGKLEYYGPDFSYDALDVKNDKIKFLSNIAFRNPGRLIPKTSQTSDNF